MEVRRGEQLKNGSEIVGNRTRVKISKNKVAPPFKEAEFDMMYGQGISHVGELLDLAVDLDIINKSGAWFNYGELRLGQGRDNVKKYMTEHTDFCDEIEKLVRENAHRLQPTSKKKKSVRGKAQTVSIDAEADDEDENVQEDKE